MDAKKCDRCGSYYDKTVRQDNKYVFSKYVSTYSNNDLVKVVDLCPTCSHLLDLWMENKAEIIVIDTDRPICGPYEEQED